MKTENEKILESWSDFLDINLPLSIELGSTKMKIREILELEDSSIIKLTRSTGEGVDVRADNQTLVRGEIIVIEDRAGVRINEINYSKKLMKFKLFPTILILLFALFGFISNSTAQETASQPNAQNVEIMGENDRLPFMQNDQTAANPEPTSGNMLFKTFGAMFLIVGLLFFGAWGVKKYGLFGVKTVVSEDAPDLKIMSSVSVASGQTVSAIRFGERVLLVGSTPQSFTLLADEYGEEERLIEQKPKSVSDFLAEENASFGKELDRAQSRQNVWNENGGKI